MYLENYEEEIRKITGEKKATEGIDYVFVQYTRTCINGIVINHPIMVSEFMTNGEVCMYMCLAIDH